MHQMWPFDPGMPEARLVVRRHDLPGGGCHWDLFIDPGGDQSLWTWRCDRPPLASGTVACERIVDHRRVWLEPGTRVVRGGRGTATHVAEGTLRVLSPRRVRVRLVDGAIWVWDLTSDQIHVTSAD